MATDNHADDERDETGTKHESGTRTSGDCTVVTRRRALALAGSGLLAGAVGPAQASSHDAYVYADNPPGNKSKTFYAEDDSGTIVYEGGDFIEAMQAGVDSLTDGRTSKEKVLVEASGKTGSHSWDGDVKAVDLPSYTVFESRGTITVNDTGDDLIVPVRAIDSDHVEILELHVDGNPRYGMWLKSVSDVQIGTVDMTLDTATDVGLGVRIDDSGNDGRSQNVSLNYAYVEQNPGHGVETYGVDGFDVGTVETVDTGGCGLLLNDTADATIQTVDATRADEGGGYAGFRCANYAGPNITVNEVNAVDCGRGIFTVSGSSGITIYDVYVESCGSNLIQDTQDTTIDGGTITGNTGEGVRIDSRSSDDHPHTKNVTVQNLTIENNDYGVYETGPDTENNAILDNHFCNNDTADIEIYASSTEVSGNTFC